MNQLSYPSIAKFQQFVELKDFRPPTKKEYVRYVRKCAEHFGSDPLSLSEDQVRSYFLFLREVKHYSRSPMKAAKFSLRSFFVECHRVTGWTVFSEVRIAEPLILPVVLSRQEVAAVLGAVREPRIGVCLELIYHCGLRVGEAVAVQVRDKASLDPNALRAQRCGCRPRLLRHFGWLSPAARKRWERIHALLDWKPAAAPTTATAPCWAPECPRCQKPMRLLGTLARSPP